MATLVRSTTSNDGDIIPVPDSEEMVDFTCATPWERLALDIELKLREWHLEDGNAAEASNVADVSLGQRRFLLHYLAEKNDNMELVLGVTKCVKLGPPSDSSLAACDVSDAATLLSAMTVAAGACGCTLPLIVRVGHSSSLRFIGRQCCDPIPLRFSCDFLPYLPALHSTLSGILLLFHNKRVSARRLQPPSRTDAVVSAEFTYFWSDFSVGGIAVPHDSFAANALLRAFHLPILTNSDPISYLKVKAKWAPFHASDLSASNESGEMRVDAVSSMCVGPPSDYNVCNGTGASVSRLPLTAAVRSCLRLAQAADGLAGPAARFRAVNVHQPRSTTLSSSASLQSVHAQKRKDDQSIASAAEPSPSSRSSSARKGGVECLTKAVMDDFLRLASEYITSMAAADEGVDHDFLVNGMACLFDTDYGRGVDAEVVDALGPSPMLLTLPQKLGRLIASAKTVSGAKILWSLFLDFVELCWESRCTIPGVDVNLEAGPDQGDSLLVQKLEMVNCCLGRMRTVRKKEVDPRGRKAKIPGIALLGEDAAMDDAGSLDNHTVSDVYVPVLQPLPYVTRDIVQAEENKMLNSANKPEEIKQNEARRQASTLKSDMMAFKAANPGACMADFVRWFSPGDWMEDDDDMEVQPAERSPSQPSSPHATPSGSTQDVQPGDGGDLPVGSAAPQATERRGRLSARMRSPGNLWQEVWDSAEAVPASQQTPLFDAGLHGFKALSDLRLMPMSEVLRQLACNQAMYSLHVLQKAFDAHPRIPSVLSAISKARHFSQQAQNLLTDTVEALAMTSEACDAVATAENMALSAASLLRKLPPGDSFVPVLDRLVSGSDVVVSDRRALSALALVIGMEEGSWRTPLTPSYRSFVIEGSNMDRMYACLASDEFRVGFRLGLVYSI